MKRSTNQLEPDRYLTRLRIRLRPARGGASSWATLALVYALLPFALTGMALTLLCWVPAASAQTVAIEAQEAKTVKAVSGVATTPDDSVCTVRWDNWPKTTANPKARGYEIRWGRDGEKVTQSVVTGYRVYQAQPLEAGASYTMQIRALDKWGRASAWSPDIAVKADSSRVDAIRQKCSIPGGFFDDFNQPEGKPDPLKWNFAVNRYTAPTVSAFAINGQNHAHIALLSKIWDRSQSAARPRQMIDFSDGGTRTVFIDMDSSPDGRDTWYLDFVPEAAPERDITGRETTTTFDKAKDIPNLLRLTQSTDFISVDYSDAQGVMSTVKTISLYEFGALQKEIIAPPVVNVRRPWKFTISKTLVEAYAFAFETGRFVKVLSAPLPRPLAFDRARVFNTVFGYNGPKNGQAAWLWHWDNFAFDAPAKGVADPVVYDYRTQLRYGEEFGLNHVIKIPDPVFGKEWAHQLLFTVAPPTAGSNPFTAAQQAKLTATVNGQTFKFLMADNKNRSIAIDLPPGLLKPGDNDVRIYLAGNGSGAINVHLEAAYTGEDALTDGIAPYTDHCAIWGCSGGMGMRIYPVGPGCAVSKIGKFEAWDWRGGATWQTKPPIGEVSGKVAVTVDVAQFTALLANGSASLARNLEILVDRKLLLTVDFAGSEVGYSAGGTYTFTLDTTELANGTHEIYARSVSPGGWESIPRYFDEGDRQARTLTGDFGGGYHPIVFTVTN